MSDDSCYYSCNFDLDLPLEGVQAASIPCPVRSMMSTQCLPQ